MVCGNLFWGRTCFSLPLFISLFLPFFFPLFPPSFHPLTQPHPGIGLGLTASLLLRPNHTIIATIRNSSTPTVELLALPKAEGSDLVIVYFDIPTDIKELEKQGAGLKNQLQGKVGWIDTVISCAGLGRDFESVKDTGLASLGEHFWANCGGSLVLFQATRDLLLVEKSGDGKEVGERKFILISSSLGSIGDMEGAIPSLAYGVSKAGANYFLRKVAFEEGGLVALAVHPG